VPLTRVVHCKRDPFDVYIGRPPGGGNEHYGNPFTHKADTKAAVVLSSRKESIEAFRLWLLGEAYQDVNPEQRQWILANMAQLQGKRLGCWCKPKAACHGDVLAAILDHEISDVAPVDQMNLFS
jgi:hypothetical protein